MQKVGNAWASELREIAPRGERNRPGQQHYADSITVNMVSIKVGKSRPLYRVAARIYANAPHSAALEWGNKRFKYPPRPLHQILDRAQALDKHRRTRGK